MTLDEARELIGHGVVYRPHNGAAEDGVITDVQGQYVFVRYRGDEWAKATSPGDLEPLQ